MINLFVLKNIMNHNLFLGVRERSEHNQCTHLIPISIFKNLNLTGNSENRT
jgi:hypothetical protein